jgi:hypothetical protein
MDAGKRQYLTKVESRAKGILIHRRPILVEWCVKRPKDLGCYYGTQSLIYQHVLDDAYCEKGRAIEISATVN